MSLELTSTLSACSIVVDVIDGRLEVTFDTLDGDTSWGEGLSEEDTFKVLGLLVARLADHHRAVS